jgi:hypothetical protein
MSVAGLAVTALVKARARRGWKIRLRRSRRHTLAIAANDHEPLIDANDLAATGASPVGHS